MYIFVYGTLKKNCPNHYVLKNGKAEFICEATTAKLFPLVVTTKYDIPFLLDQTGVGNHVHGEVYSIDEKMLEILDEFEGHPEFYERRLEVVKSTSDPELSFTAWIFTFHSFDEKLLKETFHVYYECKNFDRMLLISKKAVEAEDKVNFYKDLRCMTAL